jgi:hypothetical protein
MIVLYVSLLFLLLIARFLIARRAASLERKYTKVARATDDLFRSQPVKQGNSGRPDPYLAAKHAYLLGQAVEKRERVESKYCAWQKLADRFTSLVAALRRWKGRKLPYALGVLDVVLVFLVLDHLGYREQLSTQALVEFVRSLMSNA